ncbi:PTS sugar transporter subunit IIC [Clostridium sp. UBA4548]|uniref:PTS sugar transporter subunit IIC n=1 Tax=Clostridium sp. UBA4548 TaxID=1946361 RepID=UPI0025BCB993|nr:PTS sugar transporter subunit IIC [Clostridium sp. UBA4548]
MKRVMDFLEKYFVPFAGKIGSQRHLVAIRDGFVAIMPLILVGSLAVLFNNFPIPGWGDFMKGIFGEKWNSFGGTLWNGTFAIMSLLVVFTISYNLAKSYEKDGLTAGVVSFGSLLMLYAGSAKDWALPYGYLGAQGLFVALFVSLVATELFVKLMGNKRLVIKMPDGVPPAVGRSFAALLPSLIVLAIFGALKILLDLVGIPDIHQFIFKLIQEPLLGLASSLPAALLVVFLVHLLWFFGLHGTNILLPITSALFLPLMEANVKAFQAGQAAENIVTSSFFDTFVYMGGAGSSICLLIAILIIGKRQENKAKAKLGIAPAAFNINEPVLFGMPLVLNPIYAIPFIFLPVLLTIISYGAIAIGLVPKTIAIVHWTMPPIISGFLATGSVMGIILQLVNICIGILVYMPFVMVAEKHAKELEFKGNSNSMNL